MGNTNGSQPNNDAVPGEVVVLGVKAARGFEGVVVTDSYGENALPVFSSPEYMTRAMKGWREQGVLPEVSAFRNETMSGQRCTMEEAARYARVAGCQYVGLDMGLGVEYRTFYLS